jgi:hypothetical protein
VETVQWEETVVQAVPVVEVQVGVVGIPAAFIILKNPFHHQKKITVLQVHVMVKYEVTL